MRSDRLEQHSEKRRIILMIVLVAVVCSLTVYFHTVLHICSIVAHTYYIPIILAVAWWKWKGLIVAIFLAVFLTLIHIFLRYDVANIDYYIRAIMLVIIAGIATHLYKRIAEASQSLTEKEERLHGFMDSATDGFIIFDSELNCAEINRAGLSMFPPNTRKEDVINKNLSEITPDIKEAGRYDKYLEVIRTGNTFQIEDFVPHPKFGNLHLAVSAFKADGGLGIVFSDITEHKEAEESLRKSEEKYRQLIQNIPQKIFIKDRNSAYLYCSKNLAKDYGITPDEIVGKTDYDFFPKELADKYRLDDKRIIEASKTESIEERYIQDGKDVWVNIVKAPVKDDDGNITGILGIFCDITERKEAEDALKESEQKFRAIFDSATDGIIVTDQKNKKFYAGNKEICRMLGYSQKEFSKLEVDDIHPKESLPHVIKQFERQAREEHILAEDIPVLKKDGSVFYADINSSSITMDGHTYLMGIFRDVTERKKLDELKDEFVSTVSHELRTPLAVIKEGISLMLDEIPGKLNKKQERLLNMADNNIGRLARIISDLLDISKIEAGMVTLKRKAIDLTDLMQEVSSTFMSQIREKGLKLEISVPKTPLSVYADTDKIIQIFTNLIGNSLKSTEKGQIEICAREMEDEIECSVTDTGEGFSKNDIPHIFDKFQKAGHAGRGVKNGTGLGLPITKGLVEMHGGRIWIESEVGKGTKVLFTLPKGKPDNSQL